MKPAWVTCTGCGRRERPRCMVIGKVTEQPPMATVIRGDFAWCAECVDLILMALDGRRRGVSAHTP